MYCPNAFREERLNVMQDLIRAHPLGTLITHGPEGIRANLLPFHLVDGGGQGTLIAHLSRASDQLAALRAGGDVLVVFQGPESYLTPSWYPSKQTDARVVPTWLYVMVQASGKPQVIDDPAWLRKQVGLLTDAQESGRTHPWRVTDAPAAYLDAQLGGIIGLEIAVSRLEGKWKLDQRSSEADRLGVSHGLEQETASAELAALVKRGGA